MHRTENQTPDNLIPWATYPGKAVFVHGSTATRDWRNRLFAVLDPYPVLVLDPWKNDWASYTNALSTSIESFENYGSNVLSSGSTNPSTGVVTGFVPTPMPDIQNTPFFWENRNVDLADFHFFEFETETEIASHVIVLMVNAIKKDPTKVVVRIPKTDWRINIATFLKDLPRENYFGTESFAFDRLKAIMELS